MRRFFLCLIAVLLSASPSFGADLSAYVPGFKVPSQIAELKPMTPRCKPTGAAIEFSLCDDEIGTWIEYYEADRMLGQLLVQMPKGPRSVIWVEQIQVDKAARDRGLSTLLFGKMLELSKTEVTEVVASYAASNYSATLKEYYALTNQCSRRLNPDLNKEQAEKASILKAPFAKSLAKFGFTEVSDLKMEWVTNNGPPYVSSIFVGLKKPTP